MTSPSGSRRVDWENEGRLVGDSIGEYHVIVVLGVDPIATGEVAIGMGRMQGGKRRVAVGDLFGDSPPIRELVQADDPHGLVDNFSYGVSFGRISYRIPDAGQLFVMPTGTEPPDYEELLANPRWHRLAASFHDEQALLILAVPATAAAADKLVATADGVVLVGEAELAGLPPSRIIATLREARSSRPTPIIGIPKTATKAPAPPWSRHARTAAAAGIVLTLMLAGVAAWLAYRPFAGSGGSHARQPTCDTARGGPQCTAEAAAGGLAISPDSTRRDSTTAPASTAAPTQAAADGATVLNPADSAGASAFGVELMAAITQAGAILKVQTDGKNLPAATFAPAVIQGVRWYKVVSGAFANRSDADSLLAGLQRRKLLRGGESVVRLPYAFLIDSEVPPAAVPGMVASYVDRGQPVYALRQSNGKAWLLIGAFESIDQASLYLESLRASGITPVLVYRKGRAF